MATLLQSPEWDEFKPEANTPAEANIVRFENMDSEQLGKFVSSGVKGVRRKTSELKPAFEVLWKRFDDLRKGETINGCATRTKYCKQEIGLSIREVQHILYGRKKKPLESESSKSFPYQTKHGYPSFPVLSAIQRAIRRCEEDDAMFWASELALTNHAAQAALWTILKHSASEDIGIADSFKAILVEALFRNWEREKDCDLYYAHAVEELANARKSRIVDNALHALYGEDALGKRPTPTIPVECLDRKELERIKALLPGWMTDEANRPKKSEKPLPPYVYLKGHKKEPAAHFHDVGAKLVNCTLPDPYAERARAADIALEQLHNTG
jgi:replication-associated recombination protein RarA